MQTDRSGVTLELRPVESDPDWGTYHGIRERVLWEARGRFGEYDRDHPDEWAEGNHPFLLWAAADPVGVVRVDVRRPVAWFRRVAVREDVQRRGYGRVMFDLATRFARESGCREARSNVDPGAVGFYRRVGFDVIEGGDAGLSVAMARPL